LVGLVAVGGFTVLAGFGIAAWATRPHAPDYSGQTRTASFDFDCLNGIFWGDPSSNCRWWAGHDPAIPSDFDTSPATPGQPPVHHATGTLRFDTPTQATFTSDAGGELVLTRERVDAFHLADCLVAG